MVWIKVLLLNQNSDSTVSVDVSEQGPDPSVRRAPVDVGDTSAGAVVPSSLAVPAGGSEVVLWVSARIGGWEDWILMSRNSLIIIRPLFAKILMEIDTNPINGTTNSFRNNKSQ